MMPPKPAPSAPPMISKGARTPPEVPDPNATDQMIAFTTTSINAADDVMFALQQRRDIFIPDAERLRLDEAADANDGAAGQRPPHPMDRQPLEGSPRWRRP